jgi:hypothetical protein
MSDAAIANGAALLQSELEKRDDLVRQPLTSITYARDIPVKTGGGWVEYISALNIDYGVTGGGKDGNVTAPGANLIPVIQANLSKDLFKAIEYAIAMRIGFIDMQRSNITGRSLDRMLTDGIRLAYDKWLAANVYEGFERYGTVGLLNNPDVPVTDVTGFTGLTPDQILEVINSAILSIWTAAGYDETALPNHILFSYDVYNKLATTRLSDGNDKTILTFLLENNLATLNGADLVIAPTNYLTATSGDNGKGRFLVYVNNDKFLAVEELVPLSRAMTQPNIESLSYDSVYVSNVSEVEIFAPTIGYFDFTS